MLCPNEKKYRPDWNTDNWNNFVDSVRKSIKNNFPKYTHISKVNELNYRMEIVIPLKVKNNDIKYKEFETIFNKWLKSISFTIIDNGEDKQHNRYYFIISANEKLNKHYCKELISFLKKKISGFTEYTDLVEIVKYMDIYLHEYPTIPFPTVNQK